MRRAALSARRMDDLYERIAKKHHCLFVNGTDTLEVLEIACVHMTELGHKELAKILYNTIKENY